MGYERFWGIAANENQSAFIGFIGEMDAYPNQSAKATQ